MGPAAQAAVARLHGPQGPTSSGSAQASSVRAEDARLARALRRLQLRQVREARRRGARSGLRRQRACQHGAHVASDQADEGPAALRRRERVSTAAGMGWRCRSRQPGHSAPMLHAGGWQAVHRPGMQSGATPGTDRAEQGSICHMRQGP